jgi:PAS domain S-box-containing protein
MKLSKRFLLIPLSLAAFSYLFYSSYLDAKKRTLNDFNLQQFALAKQASRGIESFFIYYQRELLFLSKFRYVSELNDRGKDLLAEFYKSHSDQIEAITLVDAKGILKYTYPVNNSAVGQDISNQQHVKEILETHEPTVSDVFTSVQGFRAIAYHIPILENNEFKGSIAILIPIDKLGKRFIENIRTDENGYGTMISKDGVELFSPIKKNTGKSVKEIYSGFPDVLKMLERASNESQGTSIGYLSAGVKENDGLSRTIFGFYRISLFNTFWTVLIFTPEKEVLAQLTSFRNRLLILFVITMIVMGIYFYMTLKASNILKEEKKRKKVEDILRESEKRFRIMFELSPAGIILIDENGKIIEVNSSFCERLGYDRKELVGNNIRLFTDPENDKEIQDNISTILTGKTMKNEVINFKKDGTKCSVILYETRMLLPDGKQGILSVSNDITEMKKAQTELIYAKEKAEESDRLKSTFLATISHELRTPLNAIIGFSNLIVETSKDEEVTSFAKIVMNSGSHLLDLVEDIFDMTMIETGQIKINYEQTDVINLLNDVRDIIMGERIKENKTEIDLLLRTDLNKDHQVILTDSRRVKQVLINLLKNAFKFTDSGYIEFGISEPDENNGDFIKFYVKDTGIGIDKDHHDTVFKLFRQLDDSHSRRVGGTGLGLSIAKKIVEKLGGRISVESEPGKGSVFYFTLPVLPGNINSGMKGDFPEQGS